MPLASLGRVRQALADLGTAGRLHSRRKSIDWLWTNAYNEV
jgi:hypothetical protein